MRFADCLEKWLREWGIWDEEKSREGHLFAQSVKGLGPGIEDIDLNEEEQAQFKETLRAMITDEKFMAENEARHKRIIQNQ
jgi:hypothetical protein